MTPTERAILMKFFERQRLLTLVIAVVALVMAILYYGFLASFPLFLASLVLVAVTPSLAYMAAKMRKAIAAGDVVHIGGVPAKLGRVGPGFYGLQFGSERIMLPLGIYDQFSPYGEGSLTYVDRVNLLIAVNGQPLLKPKLIRRPRGMFSIGARPGLGV